VEERDLLKLTKKIEFYMQILPLSLYSVQ
jgi:hypothetical protein